MMSAGLRYILFGIGGCMDSGMRMQCSILPDLQIAVQGAGSETTVSFFGCSMDQR